MKKTFICMATSALAMALPGVAHAQSSASASATGSTTIVRAITISKTADLSFGRIVKPTSGTGAIVVFSDADGIEESGNALYVDGSPISRAKFTIEGEGGQAVSVSVPSTFTMSKGSDTIAVTLYSDLAPSVTLSNALGSGGSALLNIGGQFSLPSSQATGLYSGTFTVSVAYE
jgi:spore coat protein U-like protein